jgi:hypothetical protein
MSEDTSGARLEPGGRREPRGTSLPDTASADQSPSMTSRRTSRITLSTSEKSYSAIPMISPVSIAIAVDGYRTSRERRR